MAGQQPPAEAFALVDFLRYLRELWLQRRFLTCAVGAHHWIAALAAKGHNMYTGGLLSGQAQAPPAAAEANITPAVRRVHAAASAPDIYGGKACCNGGGGVHLQEGGALASRVAAEAVRQSDAAAVLRHPQASASIPQQGGDDDGGVTGCRATAGLCARRLAADTAPMGMVGFDRAHVAHHWRPARGVDRRVDRDGSSRWAAWTPLVNQVAQQLGSASTCNMAARGSTSIR